MHIETVHTFACDTCGKQVKVKNCNMDYAISTVLVRHRGWIWDGKYKQWCSKLCLAERMLKKVSA